MLLPTAHRPEQFPEPLTGMNARPREDEADFTSLNHRVSRSSKYKFKKQPLHAPLNTSRTR
jgi:hypothetical protein